MYKSNLLPVLLFLGLVVGLTSAALPSDIKATLAKMVAVVCSANPPTDAVLHKWAHCADSISQIPACRTKIYGYNFDNRVNMAKACKAGTTVQQKYLKCIQDDMKKARLDVNGKIRALQKNCELPALGLKK